MIVRVSIVLVLLAAVIAVPFLLRPEGESANVSIGDRERLVIISPHNESIKAEFARAFGRHMRKTQNRRIYIDWRVPGGTSEIARFLKSEYTLRFETLWKETTGLPFDLKIRDAFMNSRLELLTDPERNKLVSDKKLLKQADDEVKARLARTLFFESEKGIGIDLFFGGGAYDFSRQADSGTLVALDPSGRYGPGAIAKSDPDWFSDQIMPESVSGEPFRDSEFRWVGTVLSAFGICYNKDVLHRLGIDDGLLQWNDLADPRLSGQVALADPTKSGSTTKAFEMLIQEQIQNVLRDSATDEENAVKEGWYRAMVLILKISANARYFTDSATKVPHDVAMGDAATGMSIDFYGRTFNEIHKDAHGESRVEFVTPKDGTSIGADPIGMLRGAPNPELSHEFIRFVLSMEGQQLWNYRPGVAGGPRRFALRRPPIRKDFYTPEREKLMTDPEENPYIVAAGFTYHPEWTGRLFGPLRFIMRCACIDTHDELSAAWDDLIKAGMPDEALAEFEDISLISYDTVLEKIAPVLNAKDKVTEVELARELSGAFREKYLRVSEMARRNAVTATR